MTLMICMISIFALACSSETNGEGEDLSLEKIKEKGVFVVGLDDTFAPMGFRDNDGELMGFDIDFAEEVIERLGVEVEFKPVDWDSKELSLESGDIDAIWNGFSISPERQKKVLFSTPYLANDQIIVVASNSTIENKADLEGKIIGLQMGSTSYNALNGEPEVVETLADINQYDTNDNALLDLSADRVDAVVVDEVLGRYYISKKPDDYKVLEENFGSEEYGIGLRLEDQLLKDEIDRIIEEMKEDGTMTAISEKWFGEDIVVN